MKFSDQKAAAGRFGIQMKILKNFEAIQYEHEKTMWEKLKVSKISGLL